jgi:hypothetical protein
MLAVCWRTAHGDADGSLADASTCPAFSVPVINEWANAVEKARLGFREQERFRQKATAGRQARETDMEAELFEFDFTQLRRTSMSGVLLGRSESPAVKDLQKAAISAMRTTQGIGQPCRLLESMHERASVSVRLTCKLGGVQLHLRLAGHEQLDFSTAASPAPSLLPISCETVRDLVRKSVELGRARAQAEKHTAQAAFRESEAGERKRWKDWADVEALREQAAEMQAWKCEAEAKQGRLAAELEARLEQVARLERGNAVAAQQKAAEQEHQKRKRASTREKWAGALEKEREQRKELEEKVVRMQEDAGKEELVRRRVAEENARAQKQRSTFEAASEQAASFFVE